MHARREVLGRKCPPTGMKVPPYCTYLALTTVHDADQFGNVNGNGNGNGNEGRRVSISWQQRMIPMLSLGRLHAGLIEAAIFFRAVGVRGPGTLQCPPAPPSNSAGVRALTYTWVDLSVSPYCYHCYHLLLHCGCSSYQDVTTL